MEGLHSSNRGGKRRLTHHPHTYFSLQLFSLCLSQGGNGEENFALPDLQDRKILGSGEGFPIGLPAGTNVLDLNVPSLPPHTHGYEGG